MRGRKRESPLLWSQNVSWSKSPHYTTVWTSQMSGAGSSNRHWSRIWAEIQLTRKQASQPCYLELEPWLALDIRGDLVQATQLLYVLGFLILRGPSSPDILWFYARVLDFPDKGYFRHYTYQNGKSWHRGHKEKVLVFLYNKSTYLPLQIQEGHILS